MLLFRERRGHRIRDRFMRWLVSSDKFVVKNLAWLMVSVFFFVMLITAMLLPSSSEQQAVQMMTLVSITLFAWIFSFFKTW